MALTINTNIASINAQRRLGNSTDSLQRSYQKLSSGLRIVRASDDAAGLAIADSLRADQRIAGVAIRNANDGISLISIADGALREIGDVLTRMAELAEQSANGTLSVVQRSALASEFLALGSEVQRIAVTTTFNGIELLSGGAQVLLQIGLDERATSRIGFSGVDGTLAALGLATSGGEALAYSINAGTTAAAQTAAQSALSAVKVAISSLTSNRGTLGATESRLNVTINNLQVARENFASAESQIRDVDVAGEAAELTRLNILQQAGAAVLAQANQQPALALTLLG
ncbi:MAG: flagellin FliC [Deltaproteobacteria bacterium]|nr:flagellin FliC [Deltaproteobacteria bacterium]